MEIEIKTGGCFVGKRNAVQYIKINVEKVAGRFSAVLTYILRAIFSFLFGDEATDMRSHIRKENSIPI